MAVLVVFSALLCAVAAAPSRPIVVADLPHPSPVVHAAPVAVVSSQSHAQDELGQYSYSYSNPLSAKVETKTVDGITRGGYSYLDSHGLVQNVNYVSDDVNGFRVAASNLPLGHVTPQEDEPLVAHEKAKAVAALHEAAVKEAAEAAIVHENEVAHTPVYVEETAAPVVSVATAVLPAAPAPTAYVAAAPDVHVTPAPVTYVSPSAAPVVHVTPVPYRSTIVDHPHVHVTPTPYTSPEHPHSYATVELDSSDIPAPPPSPGAYFHPSHAAVAHSLAPIVVSTPVPPVYEPAVIEHEAPAPSPSPVAYVAPAVHAPVNPTPVAHPTPVFHSAPAPVVHAAPAPVVHAAPAPVVVTPVPHAVPVVHAAPAPVVQAAPAPVVPHAAPVAHATPVVHAAPVAVVSSQSHAQDELGQYSYSYSNPLSAKVETKTVDGVTRGGYSYLDSHGLVQNVNYVSDDHNGFRVAASNLPTAAVPVDIPDSHDVAAAKAVFFSEIAKAKAAADHAY